MQVPVFTKVMVSELTVQTSVVSEFSVGVRPDVVDKLEATEKDPMVLDLVGIVVNVMLWDALLISKEAVAVAAAL